MNNIQEIAYRKYQWHWLMTHDYYITDICIIANDWFNERLADRDNDSSLFDYIFENGINGALWVCFDEFIGCEYQDAAYMKELLSEVEYREYCENIGIKYESANKVICAVVNITMSLRNGETEEQTQDRLYMALYDGLCNNAEHQIDFVFESQELCS